MTPSEFRFVLERGFPGDSAFLEGHFPGNPIVPGAVILGYLASRLAEEGLAIERVTRMKFRRPLRGDTPFEAVLRPDGSWFRADFRNKDGIFAAASLTLRPQRD